MSAWSREAATSRPSGGRDYSWVGIWMPFRGTCLVTFKFLSPWWHGDRSLPVWRRGRESFLPPLSAADTKRRAGCLPSAAGWRCAGPYPSIALSALQQRQPSSPHPPQPGEHREQVSPASRGPWLQTVVARHLNTPFNFPQMLRFAKPLPFQFLCILISSPHMLPITMQNNHVNFQLR